MKLEARVAAGSTVECPIGKPALVVPDVFPSATEQDDLSDVHDIIKAAMPNLKSGGSRKGRLRVALATTDAPAYIDPALPVEEQHRIRSGYRPTAAGQIVVNDSQEVPRGMIRVDDLTARVSVDGGRVYLPRPEKLFYKAWPIEPAIAFAGRIALADDEERHMFGIYIHSEHEHGWVRVLEANEAASETPKIQREPSQAHTYEEILSRLR